MKKSTSRKSASATAAGEPKADVYQMVTDKIVAALESGTIPWRQPWDARKSTSGPRNAITGKAYRGVNPWLLEATALAMGYTDPRWLTYKQAAEVGGNVRKGEKSTMVVFWKIGQTVSWNTDDGEAPKGEDGKPKVSGDIKISDHKVRKTFLLRYYNVFNVEQCDGLKLAPITSPLADHEPIELAEAVIANMPNRPVMRFGNAAAFYTPSADTIDMPVLGAFREPAGYYATAFHELSHSTGHKSRLDRHGLETGIAAFGSEVYSREELAAEFGAAFLCASVGLSDPTLDNSAAYIASWVRALKDDRKLVVVAASQGQRAADYVLSGSMAEETADED